MSCLPMWFLIAALGQAPAADGWLDAVPAEADVVIHVRGVRAVRDDLLALIKAVNPAMTDQAGPGLDQAIEHLKTMAGDRAVTDPFLTLVRAVPPQEPHAPPFAIVVKSTSYEGVLGSLNGGKAQTLKHDPGGFDSFDGPNGMTIHAAKGPGTVAFGPDKTLIAAFAKPGAKTLGKLVSPGVRKELFSGDLGLYVNVAALTGRYGEAIDQAKQGMLGALDQAGQQQPAMAATMDMIKPMYAGLFDSVKEADAFALSLDFAADGVTIDGDLTVKADSKTAKSIAGAKSGDAAGLAKLPADAAYFFYMNLDAKTFESLQKAGLAMMSAGGKATPEVEAALAKQREQGRIEAVTAMTIAKGMKGFNLYNVADPKAICDTTEAFLKAFKTSDSPMNIYKDVTITHDAETYGGFKFIRMEMTLDPEKLAKLTAGNPAQAAQMKAMFGGDKITSWLGVGDKQMLQITAPSWDEAKAQLDAYQKGEGTLGASPAFAAARAKLPKDVNVLMLLIAQGILRQVATQFGGPPDEALKSLPKEPILIGASMTTTPGTGFEFRLVIPSAIGQVIPKGGPAPANP